MNRDVAAEWVQSVHDEATALFEELDGAGKFQSTEWERAGGGGGVSRLLVEGQTFEKAGINRSVVHGARGDGSGAFFAAGVSLVAHPWNPHVPTVHLNVRYLERETADGEWTRWFGGGTDLTPTWPHPEDAVHFHAALREICARHHPRFHARFKRWCDEYFVNTHRGGEARGVGGIFFDDLMPGDDLDEPALAAFVDEVGRCLAGAYAPIVRCRRETPSNEEDRQLQLFRRGRYVEFNLLHDRGTRFGLETGARMDSVLMSLPPLASWPGSADFPEHSPGAQLREMLRPRDWAASASPAGREQMRLA
ncbi:MAG TPA: oxygen-dependent coproporphyrinogen oxidase [Gemmatimonadales bacterium]|nr:oxygen-dependent coproporphyrinogen oxidase [Gemmatimonadales bacterium]